jgi:membrane protein required for colicin V production
VREAKSLPYIKSTGSTLRYTLESYLPSSLTAPPGEQPPEEAPTGKGQQGSLEKARSDELALEVRGKYHISVTWLVRAG